MNKNRPTLLLFRLITGAQAVREQKHYDGEILPYTLRLRVKEVGFLKDATITDEESSPVTRIKANPFNHLGKNGKGSVLKEQF